MGDFVNVKVTDGLSTIRLDRPPMNALNARFQAELSQAVAEVGADTEVRAALSYGGPKPFAAGADVKEMADKAYPDLAMATQRLEAAFTAIARFPKPVMATITGCASGGGLELALCADFRVFADAVKLRQLETLLGILPGWWHLAAAPVHRTCPGQRSRVHRAIRGRSPARPASGQAGHRQPCRSRRRPGDRAGPLPQNVVAEEGDRA